MKTTNIIVKAAASALLACMAITAQAQQDTDKRRQLPDRNDWEFEVKAGVNIGGAAPMSIPQEIRKIDSYSPRLNASIEGVATKWLGTEHKWGLSAGVKFEQKGMITGATTKGYSMEIINDGERVSGFWTGYVKTRYTSTFVTVPVMANYSFNKKWKARAGIFASFRMDGEFNGSVSEGYLREGSPIGEKIVYEGDQTATYDFSSNLNHFHWGLQLGGTWQVSDRFTLNTDLSWAMNNIFESNFKTISFNMYPIFLNIGFGYKF